MHRHEPSTDCYTPRTTSDAHSYGVAAKKLDVSYSIYIYIPAEPYQLLCMPVSATKTLTPKV